MTQRGVPIFIADAPEFARKGDNIHITGSIDGVPYHRVVPLAVLHLAVNRALAILTGPAPDAKVERLRSKDR